MNQTNRYVVTVTYLGLGNQVVGTQPWIFNGVDATDALARASKFLHVGRRTVLTVDATPLVNDDSFDNNCQ